MDESGPDRLRTYPSGCKRWMQQEVKGESLSHATPFCLPLLKADCTYSNMALAISPPDLCTQKLRNSPFLIWRVSKAAAAAAVFVGGRLRHCCRWISRMGLHRDVERNTHNPEKVAGTLSVGLTRLRKDNDRSNGVFIYCCVVVLIYPVCLFASLFVSRRHAAPTAVLKDAATSSLGICNVRNRLLVLRERLKC